MSVRVRVRAREKIRARVRMDVCGGAGGVARLELLDRKTRQKATQVYCALYTSYFIKYKVYKDKAEGEATSDIQEGAKGSNKGQRRQGRQA